MLDIKNSRNLSRTFPALCLVLFPLLFLAGDLLFGDDPPDSRGIIAQVATNPGAFQLGFLCYLAGTVLMIWGLVGVLHLLRGRGLTVGQVGAGLTMFGGVVAASFFGLFPLFITAVATPDLDQDQLVRLLDAFVGSPIAAVLFSGLLIGVVAGQLVLAVGLLLRRAVPVWAPIALIASTVITFFGTTVVLYAVGTLLLLAGMAAIAWRMYTLSDDQWAQWQSLPDRRVATPASV